MDPDAALSFPLTCGQDHHPKCSLVPGWAQGNPWPGLTGADCRDLLIPREPQCPSSMETGPHKTCLETRKTDKLGQRVAVKVVSAWAARSGSGYPCYSWAARSGSSYLWHAKRLSPPWEQPPYSPHGPLPGEQEGEVGIPEGLQASLPVPIMPPLVPSSTLSPTTRQKTWGPRAERQGGTRPPPPQEETCQNSLGKGQGCRAVNSGHFSTDRLFKEQMETHPCLSPV